MDRDQHLSSQKSKAVNSGQAKYLRSLDRSIRKKWNQLRVYKKNKIQVGNEDPLKTRKLQTEPIQSTQAHFKLNPYAVQFFRENKKREVIRDRNKKNEDIFYRKRPSKTNSKNLSRSLSLDKKKYVSEKFSQIKKTKESVQLPLMLQKRKKKLEKQMEIIQNISSKSMNRINERQSHRQELIHEHKQKLIQSLRGTKLYYKFIQKWQMPRYPQ